MPTFDCTFPNLPDVTNRDQLPKPHGMNRGEAVFWRASFVPFMSSGKQGYWLGQARPCPALHRYRGYEVESAGSGFIYACGMFAFVSWGVCALSVQLFWLPALHIGNPMLRIP